MRLLEYAITRFEVIDSRPIKTIFSLGKKETPGTES